MGVKLNYILFGLAILGCILFGFMMLAFLYLPDKTYNVWLNAKTKKVYDPYTTATCILGLVFSTGVFITIGIGLLL